MATPNYSYEKRQRELAKKRKAEEKRQKKTHRGPDSPPEDGDGSSGEPQGGADQPNPPPANTTP